MAENIWATDGGVYFGHRVMPDGAGPDRSLTDEEWRVANDKLHLYTGDRHLGTVGPSGSGKTRRQLLVNAIRLVNWSMLIVDPKGVLTALTGPHRNSAHPGSVITIDPFGVLERDYPALVKRYPFLRSVRCNPVAALDPTSEEFPDNIRGLAEAIIPLENKTEPHWDYSAQEFVGGAIMAVRVEDGQYASLASVRDLATAEADALALEIKTNILPLAASYPAIAAKLGRFTKISPENRELMSILSTVQTKTAWLDSLPIQRDLSGNAIDFSQMKHRPMTVYLILPPRFLASHSTWLRLMVTAVLQPLMRSARPAKVPVLFMLDEFAQLKRLPAIEDNLALLREYGVKLWPVFQDFAQAQDIYQARWESFISNTGVLSAFAPQDVTSRKYLSELSGQRLYWVETASRNASASFAPHLNRTTGTQDGWQHIQGPVYWPQGLAQMADGQAVLYSRGRALRSYLPDPSEIPSVSPILERAMREMDG